jgi:hypothetical protein
MIVTNNPPVLDSGFTLTTQMVAVGSSISYKILAHDPDGYTPITLNISPALPSFITSTGMTFHISPLYTTPATTYIISFSLFDSV